MRNFGIPSGRLTTGAHHQPSAYGANITHADSYSLSPQRVFHRQDIPDPPLDIRSALGVVLFVLVTGLSVFVGGFFLLFVAT